MCYMSLQEEINLFSIIQYNISIQGIISSPICTFFVTIQFRNLFQVSSDSTAKSK